LWKRVVSAAILASQYEILEGIVSHVTAERGSTEFILEEHYSKVAGLPSALPLADGDYVRALVRKPGETTFFRVLALQRRGEKSVHYAGPRISVPIALIAALVIAASLWRGLWWVVIGTAPLVALWLLIAAHEAEIVRRFEAYCRTSPMGAMQS